MFGSVWIRSAEIRNFKSIEASGTVELSRVTVLIGPNNAGKSAFIHALYSLQVGSLPPSECLRAGSPGFSVTIEVDDASENPWQAVVNSDRARIEASFSSGGPQKVIIDGSHHTAQIAQQEPNAFFYPQLGKRKVVSYNREVNASYAGTVLPSWHNLVSKLQRLSNPDFPGSQEYRSACEAILGFVVTVFPSEIGQQAGRYIDRDTAIPLEQMGEGVSAVAGLLADVASAEGRCFLIEEPENDLHPAALKELLALLLRAAERNQLIVTTHSNTVLKYLGSHPETRIIKVTSNPAELPPVSRFESVANTPTGRLALLRELGYELFDFDLYDAWLIFEESSAERIVRQYFLRWYVPALVGRLRTLSAGGTGNVEPTFADFSRLFLYAHLQPTYAGRAWVLVDGDASGRNVVKRLRGRFGDTWAPSNFRSLSREDFEQYYPSRFSADVAAISLIPRGKGRQEAKSVLLATVVAWIEEDEDAAKAAFADSAQEVIGLLQEIKRAICD
jgi:hypothetical protein